MRRHSDDLRRQVDRLAQEKDETEQRLDQQLERQVNVDKKINQLRDQISEVLALNEQYNNKLTAKEEEILNLKEKLITSEDKPEKLNEQLIEKVEQNQEL